ncbi:MAG: sensor histidine kinase N-terminal domain-containing protein, partial [Kiloniellaceae bacterium]
MSPDRERGKAPWSIAQRLSSLLTIALTALWLVAVAAAAAVVNHETNEVFDSALQETAQRLVPLVVEDFGEQSESGDHEDEARVVEERLEFASHEEYLVYQVRDAEGHVLLRSHDAPVR